MIIRPIAPADAPALSRLVTQLGYPAPAEVLPERVEKLSASAGDGDSMAVVAEDPNGNVVGLITTRLFWSLHSEAPLAWVIILVVLDSARGKGVGSLLLNRAEEWAMKKGAQKISLASGVHRLDTHKYYDNRGYERSGIRFTKRLERQ